MKITSTITLDDMDTKKQEHILTLFANEDKQLKNNRASYTITKEEKRITITITAKDTIALRAVLCGIGKTLASYDKIKGLLENE